jgi:hypothetical protein
MHRTYNKEDNYTKNRTKDNCSALIPINFCLFLGLCVLGAFLSVSFIIPYVNYHNYTENTCLVENVVIPQVPPSVNLTGWEHCDCGFDCRSYSLCADIYTNISQNFMKENYFSINVPCTFYETECLEHPNYNSIIQDSQNIYNEYFNQNLTCYYDTNNLNTTEIFLENDVSLTTLLVVSITLGICILFFLVISCILCFKKDKEDNCCKGNRQDRITPIFQYNDA